MLKKLDLTDRHIELVKRICDLEHNSIIRCHSSSEDHLDKLADDLNMERITLKEFHHELSNAFYEFQVLYENPKSLTEMDAHYFDIFSSIGQIYREELSRDFPDIYDEFIQRLFTINLLNQENPPNPN